MFTGVIGHERQKTLLEAAIRHDRVAHAYLFHGDAHIGKRLMAVRLAQALNCEGPADAGEPDGCGPCRSCRQIEARTHPDFLLIEPDQEMANPQIKIEQVREIESQIIYRPLIGRFKIVLIDEADRLKTPSLEQLRDHHDRTGIGVIWCWAPGCWASSAMRRVRPAWTVRSWGTA